LERVILEDIASIGVTRCDFEKAEICLEILRLGVFGKECAVVTKEEGWERFGIEKSA
jgi:hypothetical protein